MMKASLRLQDTALRYFLEVARYGSITEASLHLNVASSAISRQINRLEDIVETKLFERRPRGMELSAAGEMLAVYARKNALESDRVVSNIAALEGLNRGHIHISCFEGFAMDFLPRCIASFREKYDGVLFHIHVRSPEDVSINISNDDSDIGVTFSLSPTKNIHVAYRQPSPIVAVMHPNHPLASKKSLTLTQMYPYPIALPEKNTTLRQLFDISSSRLNLIFEPVLVSNNVATLNHFTEYEGGIHLAGKISIRNQLAIKKLVGIPIRDRGMDIRNIEVQTLSGRSLPATVRVFLDYMINQMKLEEMSQPLEAEL